MKDAITTLGIALGTSVAYDVIGVLFINQQDKPVLAALISLLLPTVKYVGRFVQMSILKEYKEGLDTVIAAFELQFFNTLYIAAFMETVTSPLNILVLMLVDVVENTFFLYNTHRKARELRLKPHANDGEGRMQLLFRTELVVLFEFIEVVTPVIYGVWITGIFFSTNKKYTTGLETADMDYYSNAMQNLAFLTFAQAISLILFVTILTHQYQLPIFRQLHYALNAYGVSIVALRSLGTGVVFCSRLKHFGNDYTFDFDY